MPKSNRSFSRKASIQRLYSARYAKLGRHVGKLNRHLFKHPQAQRWNCASCCHGNKIFMCVQNGVIKIFCGYFTMRYDRICSLMQIKFTVGNTRDERGSFARDNYGGRHIKEPTIALFHNLRSVIKRVFTRRRGIFNIGFTSCYGGESLKFNIHNMEL